MNIAFGSVVLFLIIVPGIILRRFYFTEEFSKKNIRNTIVDEMVFAIIPALIIHFSAIILLHAFSLWQINFNVIAILLTGSNNIEEVKNAFGTLRDNLTAVLVYNFTIWNVSAAIGISLRVFVRRNKMDRKFQILKYDNDWHYLLNGEFIDFPKIGRNSEDIDLIFVDALAKTDGGTTIYTGILVDYKLASGGVLDFIILRETKKGYISSTTRQYTNTESIPGDFFIIFYNQILNLNLTYYSLEEEEED